MAGSRSVIAKNREGGVDCEVPGTGPGRAFGREGGGNRILMGESRKRYTGVEDPHAAEEAIEATEQLWMLGNGDGSWKLVTKRGCRRPRSPGRAPDVLVGGKIEMSIQLCRTSRYAGVRATWGERSPKLPRFVNFRRKYLCA